MGGSESKHSDTSQPGIGGTGSSNSNSSRRGEEEEEEEQGFGTTALAVGAAAAVGTALLAWGVSRLGSSSSSSSASSESDPKVGYDYHQFDRYSSNNYPDPPRKGGSDRVSRPAGLIDNPGGSGWASGPTGVMDTRRWVNTAGGNTLKILIYNVWSKDLKTEQRMKAIGELIEKHSPDLICFQEVTPVIYAIFQRSYWWRAYQDCSTDMANKPYFCMQLSKVPVKLFMSETLSKSKNFERELCVAKIQVARKELVVATSHLKSPYKWDRMYTKARVAQAEEALDHLKDSPNVIFGGDMNWNDLSDGQFPLPDGWVDAWVELCPGEAGYTYDTKSNKMLCGNHRSLQKRLDRFVCNLSDFTIRDIQLIGTEAIPGLSYFEEEMGKIKGRRPVFPSDHYGLLLTISTTN